MATVSLSTTVNTDDTATITDETVFTSPARSGVGVFLNVYKVNYLSAQTAVTVTSDDSDPETDSSWTFDLNEDGWYQAYYVAVPDYDSGTTYAQYDATFDPTTNVVYRSKTAGNIGQSLSNTTYWEVISDPASLAANLDTSIESANIDSLVYNDIILNSVTELRGDKAFAAAQECGGDCDDCTDSAREFSMVDFNMEAALIAEIRQQYAAAERYVRRLDELVIA